MVTTKNRAIGYTQKEMRREFKHSTIKNQLITKEDSNVECEEQKGYRAYRKKPPQLTEINPSLTRLTLNINGINSSIKSQRLAEYMKKKKILIQPYAI